MDKLWEIKHKLIACVDSQIDDLEHVDAKELGMVIDMIKDISEAVYYCTIVEAMQETPYVVK